MAAWRDYDEDMGNQPTGRELGAPDPLGGLDCGHPPLNGADSTNAASPATATEPADQYAASIGQIGAGAGGLHGADEFLAYWVALLEASPAYHLGQMLIVVTFDEGDSADGTACCGEAPGPDSPTPGFSPLLAPIFQRYVEPGSVDSTGQYNHYSALRRYEDLLGITRGGTDGLGHLGFAAASGLQPFGRDVFNRPYRRR